MRTFRNILFLMTLLLCSKVSFACNKAIRFKVFDPLHNMHASFTLPDTTNGNISAVVKQIASYKLIHVRLRTLDDLVPSTYLQDGRLLEKATSSQLLKLLNDSSAEVRVYAFWELKARNYPKIKKVVIEHISDTLSFRLKEGCILDDLTINLYFLKYERNLFTATETKKYLALISKFYKKEVWKYRSMYFFDPL